MQTDPKQSEPRNPSGRAPDAGEPVPAPAPLPAEEGAHASEPITSDPGRMVAAPALDHHAMAEAPPGAPATPADARAGGQLLTGAAARAALSPIPLSPGRLAWRKLKKNKLALSGGVVLIVLYLVALFAPFIAPYGYTSQERGSNFRPPMPVRLTPAPTVYEVKKSRDQFLKPIFIEDASRPLPIRFFVRGEPYKLFGVIPTNVHLFGVEGGKRIYLLGSDQFGRDYLSRLLYASQISLSVGLLGILITFTLGLLVGGISGFYGGRIDDVIMRLCEVIMSVPDFYLLLALAGTLPPTLPPVQVYVMIVIILSFVGWAGMARIIRGMVLSVREREYVEAARSLGVSDFRIIIRHVLPSTFTYAIVSATLSIPGYILAEAGLSFLNLGIRDPMPSWGNMLSAAQNLTTLEQRTWILAPGVMIFLTTLAFNFLGDGVRDALDPKSR